MAVTKIHYERSFAGVPVRKLEPRRFSGQILEYAEFRYHFYNDTCPCHVSAGSKLLALKQLLRGDPLNYIDHISCEEPEAVEKAFGVLNKVYGDPGDWAAETNKTLTRLYESLKGEELVGKQLYKLYVQIIKLETAARKGDYIAQINIELIHKIGTYPSTDNPEKHMGS